MQFTFNGVHYRADRFTFRMATLIEGAFGGPIKACQQAAQAGETKAIVALIYGVVHTQDPSVTLDDILDADLSGFQPGEPEDEEETDFEPAPEDPSDPAATN